VRQKRERQRVRWFSILFSDGYWIAIKYLHEHARIRHALTTFGTSLTMELKPMNAGHDLRRTQWMDIAKK
jgi:hypothetical protein